VAQARRALVCVRVSVIVWRKLVGHWCACACVSASHCMQARRALVCVCVSVCVCQNVCKLAKHRCACACVYHSVCMSVSHHYVRVCVYVCVSLSMPAASEFSACVYHSVCVCVCVCFRSPDKSLQPIQVAAAPLDRERAHPLWQGILHRVAVCCSVLQCIAVRCWIAGECIHFGQIYCSVLQRVAACYSAMLDCERARPFCPDILQCVAVRCWIASASTLAR